MTKKVAKCMMEWLILGKTALNYSIVTIYLRLCPRVPLFPFLFGKRSNDTRDLGGCKPTSRPMTLPLLAQGAVTVCLIACISVVQYNYSTVHHDFPAWCTPFFTRPQCTTTLKCIKPNFYGSDGRFCNSQPDFHLLNVHRE